MFKKRQPYRRIQVIFTNDNTKFITEYFGNINYLLNELQFITTNSYRSLSKYRMIAHRESSVVDFSYLNDKYAFGFFITVNYIFDIENDEIDLEKFKALVQPYGFIVENMEVTTKEN